MAQNKRKPSSLILGLLVATSSLTVGDDAAAPKEQPAKFKITTRKKEDAVASQLSDDKTVFVVKSPSGISQAVIERLHDKWPAAVVLRLHLKGLESFRASTGKVTLDAAVSSQDGKVRLWKDGNENAPLDQKSTFWTAIRIVGGGDGQVVK